MLYTFFDINTGFISESEFEFKIFNDIKDIIYIYLYTFIIGREVRKRKNLLILCNIKQNLWEELFWKFILRRSV